MKRALRKTSVQAIIIGTIVALVVFALGVIVNFSVKNGDNDECNEKKYAKMDQGNASHIVDHSKKCGLVKVIFLTATYTTIIPDNHDSSSSSMSYKILGVLFTCSLFVFFYLMLIFCLARRQTHLLTKLLGAEYNEKLENDLQNVSNTLCSVQEKNV